MKWTVKTLRQIVKTRLPETDEREYKSKAALHPAMTQKEANELSKDVSAMANYPGGVLILGIDEEKDTERKERLPKRLNGYSPGEITKEWIEDKLSHLVQPRLVAYNVRRVSAVNDGDIYIIEIPRSSSAPHQASDYRYYRRKGASSVPADHLEIEGIRNVGAPIELGIELYGGDTHGVIFDRVDVNIVVRNEGDRPSTGVYVSVFVPISRHISYGPRSAPQDPRPMMIEDSEYRKFHMQFGANHVQEILYPGQATEPMPIVRLREPEGKSLLDCEPPDAPIIFQVQTLDGYKKVVRRNLKELIKELLT